jgi:hypothetical protein
MITIKLDDLAEIDVTLRCSQRDLLRVAERLNTMRDQTPQEVAARFIIIAALFANAR